MEKNIKDVEKSLSDFLGQEKQEECKGEECIINNDKSILERINKKIITSDGRQLLT